MGTDSLVVVSLSLSDLESRWAEIESVIDETAEIDRWCSGPDWVLPVHAGFGQDAEPLLFQIDTFRLCSASSCSVPNGLRGRRVMRSRSAWALHVRI